MMMSAARISIEQTAESVREEDVSSAQMGVLVSAAISL
jgi:hypothetical protein